MKPANINTLIDTLRNFELTFALLYETYSTMFESESETWQIFAEEARLHARRMAALKLYLQNHTLTFEETKIMIHLLNKSIQYLQEQIDWARGNKMNIREAILISQKIGNFLLESAFMDVFHCITPGAITMKETLVEQMKDHQNKLSYWQQTIENNAQLMYAQA